MPRPENPNDARFGPKAETMIKDVMVLLDGTAADEARFAAVNDIAEPLRSHIIGLDFNLLPRRTRSSRQDAPKLIGLGSHVCCLYTPAGASFESAP
jgi:hypothetical protein